MGDGRWVFRQHGLRRNQLEAHWDQERFALWPLTSDL